MAAVPGRWGDARRRLGLRKIRPITAREERKSEAGAYLCQEAETRMVEGYLTVYMPIGISPVVVCGCTEPLSTIQRIVPTRRLAGLMTISLINLQG